MKTGAKTIEVLSQACCGAAECKTLIASAVAGGEASGDFRDRYGDSLLFSLFDYETSYTVRCVKLDRRSRVKTVYTWQCCGHDWKADIFPKGDFDTCLGVNVYCGETLAFTDSWDIESLYNYDLIDLEGDYDD